jgi:hypothetical protein
MEISDKNIREVLKSETFDLYYQSLDERSKNKYDYVIQIIKTIKVVSEKFVKKIKIPNFTKSECLLAQTNAEQC